MSLFIKRARGEREYAEAARIVHNRFIQKKFFEPNRPFRWTLRDLVESSVTLIGVNEKGCVQNTLSLVAPKSYASLHMSEIFARELEELRWRGSLVEVWRLASHPNSNCWDTLRLMRAALREAHGLGRDIMVAAAHPDFENFYGKLLGFQTLAAGEIRHYKDVADNPAIGFFKPIVDLTRHRLAVHA